MGAPSLFATRLIADTMNTRYGPLMGLSSGSSTAQTVEAEQRQRMPCAGTIKELRLQAFSDPGAGNSIAVTLRVNGSSTALTVTISDTTRYAEDLSNEVAVAAGDLVDWIVVPTSNPTDETNMTVTAVFISDDDNIPLLGHNAAGNAGDLNYSTGIGSTFAAWDSSLDNSEKSKIPIAGTITAFYVEAVASSVFSAGTKLRLFKNGSVEASADITLGSAAGTHQGAATGLSIAVAAGDDIEVQLDIVSVYNNTSIKWGVAFTPTTPNQSLISFGVVPSTSAASYPGLLTGHFVGLSSEQPWPMPECTIKDVSADVSTAPGSGKTWDIDTRVGSTLGGVANGNTHLDIDGTATSDSDTTSDALSAGHFFAVKFTPGGTPTGVGDAMRIWATVEFPSGLIIVPLAGALPAMAGVVAPLVLQALTGVLPAMSGAIGLSASIGVQGSLPAQSGLVAVKMFSAPTGVLPAMSGAIGLSASIGVQGSLPAQSGLVAVKMFSAPTGVLPAMSGAIGLSASIGVQGSLPAQSGLVAVKMFSAPTGDLPAMSGAIAYSAIYSASVAGNLPAMSGVVAFLQSVLLAGDLPAQSGALQLLAHIALAGDLPSQSGDISAVLPAVHPTGNLPAQSGALALAATIALGGNLPAMSGDLDWDAVIAVLGALPAMSGDVAALQRIFLAGNLPAMSGALSLQAAIAVLGNLPAMAGALGIDATIALLGNLPAQSGEISSDSILTVLGNLPSQSGFVYATPVVPDQSHRRKVLMLDGRRR